MESFRHVTSIFRKIFRLYVRYLTNDYKIFHVFRSCKSKKEFLQKIPEKSIETEKYIYIYTYYIIPGQTDKLNTKLSYSENKTY